MRGTSLIVAMIGIPCAFLCLSTVQAVAEHERARHGSGHAAAVRRETLPIAAFNRFALRPAPLEIVQIPAYGDCDAAIASFALGEQIRALGQSIREFNARHPELTGGAER